MNSEKDFDSGKYGIKNLYQASIKVLYPMDIMGFHYDAGDTLLYFDDIQEISFLENKNIAYARGGFNNKNYIVWESTSGIDCVLNMGTISPLSFGLANGSVVKKGENKSINQFERYYVSDDGKIVTKHTIDETKKVNIYELENDRRKRKILDFSVSDNTIILTEKNIDILVDYYFNYESKSEIINVGQKDLNGYLMFVGKFRYTDEYTAVEKTGILEIPQLRINSNFQINLGRNINPLLTYLQFEAIPVGQRHSSKTVIITYLDEDIDGDF